jgi:RNA polymerase sigma factor (sigma-70 family)
MHYDTKSPNWLTEIYPVVKRFAYATVRDRELADELAQDLVEGLLKCGNLPETVNDPWLRTRLNWLVINQYRARGKKQKIFVPEPEGGWERMEEAGTAGDAQILRPDTALYQTELASEVATAVSELPRDLQAIMKLVLADQTDAEIAETLRIDRVQVWKRRQIANALLLQRLEHFRDGDTDGNVALQYGSSDRESAAERLANKWEAEHKRLRELATSLHLTWVGPIKRAGGLTVWRCELGYEWIETAKNLEARSGCPHCLKKRQLNYSHYHALAKQKELIFIGELPAGYLEPTRWKCVKEGHRWYASYAQVAQSIGCPACSHHGPLSVDDYRLVGAERGIKFVAFKMPRNANEVTEWECVAGHHWMASHSNIYRGRGCPTCAGCQPKTVQDYHQLAASRGFKWLGPMVGNVKTPTVWQCQKDHVWMAKFHHVAWGTGCPNCAGTAKKTPADYTKLAGNCGFIWRGPMPENTRTPTTWECSRGHRWQAKYSNIDHGTGCPDCGKKTVEDYHALATTKGLTWCGSEVPKNGNTPTWWQCADAHSFESTYAKVAPAKRPCPECNKKGRHRRGKALVTAAKELINSDA